MFLYLFIIIFISMVECGETLVFTIAREMLISCVTSNPTFDDAKPVLQLCSFRIYDINFDNNTLKANRQKQGEKLRRLECARWRTAAVKYEKKSCSICDTWSGSIHHILHTRFCHPECPYSDFNMLVYSVHTTSTSCPSSVALLKASSIFSKDFFLIWFEGLRKFVITGFINKNKLTINICSRQHAAKTRWQKLKSFKDKVT